MIVLDTNVFSVLMQQEPDPVIVASRHATLATRNIRDFANLGIDLIDPWRPSAQP